MSDINSDKKPEKITKFDTSQKRKEIIHPKLGVITLRLFLSFKDVENIIKYNNSSDTIDFCKKFIYAHFIDPPFKFNEVYALSEDEIKELVITYTSYYCALNQGVTLCDDLTALENFKTNTIEYSQKIIYDFDSLSSTLSKISLPSNIEEIYKSIFSISNIYDSLTFNLSDLLKGIQGIQNSSSIYGLSDYSNIIPDALSKTCLNSVSSALSDIQFPTYDSLQIVIESLIPQSLPSFYNITSIIPSDLVKCSVSPLSTIFTTPQINLYESLPSLFDIAEISKYFPTISEISNSWLKELNRSIDSIKALSEQVLISHVESEEILIKYKWLISPSFPYDSKSAILEIYRNQSISPRKKYYTINQIFREYLTGKNCKELIHLVKVRTDYPIIKKRKKILMDCVWAIKRKNSRFNPSNLVIPVLISQIDGILYDFFIHMNWKPDRTQWIDTTKTHSGKKNQIETFTCIVTKQQAIFQSAIHLLVNVLLQSALPDESKEELSVPHTLSRHKILHGQFTTYGRLDNALRCFLIIDFLSYLFENSDRL